MKTLWKQALVGLVALLMIIAMSACGGQATGDGNGGSTPTAAPPTPTVASTPTTTASGDVVVKTATATVDGQSKTILTDAKGMTLYYYTPDAPHKIACTGACAENWPPLLFTGTGEVKASTTLPGELEAYQDTNGNQVVYNDHYLYTYVADTAPGDVKGQGVGGKWYVATPDLQKA